MQDSGTVRVQVRGQMCRSEGWLKKAGAEASSQRHLAVTQLSVLSFKDPKTTQAFRPWPPWSQAETFLGLPSSMLTQYLSGALGGGQARWQR